MAGHTDVPLPRPIMLGILLEPRLDSPINADNKDEWDFVLRRCFVTEAQPLRHALKNLAFGGEGLKEKIESEGTRFAGIPVSCDKMVRDLEVDEWARVVDVFKKWAFKPVVSCGGDADCGIGLIDSQSLILDVKAEQDSRQFGQD